MQTRLLLGMLILCGMAACARNPKPTPTPTPVQSASIEIEAEALPRLPYVPAPTQTPRRATAPLTAGETARANDSIIWDYAPGELALFGVVRFEVCVEDPGSLSCLQVTPDASRTALQPDTTPGMESFAMKLPALTVGAHVMSVKACALSECSDVTTTSFNFLVKPKPPSKVRIGR